VCAGIVIYTLEDMGTYILFHARSSSRITLQWFLSIWAIWLSFHLC